jgi:hypothetical protein
MAFEAPGASEFSFDAGADLSALQYHFVKLNSSGQVVAIAATTDQAIGILQNKPGAGESATVWMAGISKYKTSAAIAAGAVVGVSANGRGVGAATKSVGQALDTTTGADQLGSIAFDCRRPYATAIS